MKIKVYQIDPEKDARELLLMNYDCTELHGGVKAEEYKCIFDGEVEARTLEGVFAQLNKRHPVGYNGHTLSVSDIVETEDGVCHFCDAVGFVRLPDFDSSRAAPIIGHRMLVIEPMKAPYPMLIPDGLAPLQQAVDGYIECTYPFEGDNAFVISNEEAKLQNLPGNRHLNGDIYAGVMLIAGDDGHGGTTDLTDEQIEKYTERFAEPELISDAEVQKNNFIRFIGFV